MAGTKYQKMREMPLVAILVTIRVVLRVKAEKKVFQANKRTMILKIKQKRAQATARMVAKTKNRLNLNNKTSETVTQAYTTQRETLATLKRMSNSILRIWQTRQRLSLIHI